MKETFDNYWEQVHSRTEWGQYPAEHVIRFIARNFYNTKRDEIRILDFGCGGVLILGIWLEKDLIRMRLMDQIVLSKN